MAWWYLTVKGFGRCSTTDDSEDNHAQIIEHASDPPWFWSPGQMSEIVIIITFRVQISWKRLIKIIAFHFQPCKGINSTRFDCPTPDINEATSDKDEPTQSNCNFTVQHRDLQNSIQVIDTIAVSKEHVHQYFKAKHKKITEKTKTVPFYSKN